MIKIIRNMKIDLEKLQEGCAVDVCYTGDYEFCAFVDVCNCDGGDCHINGGGGAF